MFNHDDDNDDQKPETQPNDDGAKVGDYTPDPNMPIPGESDGMKNKDQ